jgi:hypothetical protein
MNSATKKALSAPFLRLFRLNRFLTINFIKPLGDQLTNPGINKIRHFRKIAERQK